jgi:hypothetical protein
VTVTTAPYGDGSGSVGGRSGCGTLPGMTDPADRLLPADQRALAVRLFNRTWELLETTRDAAGDRELLATALASRLHWQDVGTDENLAAGDWLVAHVASHLGYADLALDFAAAAHERASTADPPVELWLVASAQEGMARAHAVAGHDQERDQWAADARATLAGVDDDEDRELIESQLATVPGLAQP